MPRPGAIGFGLFLIVGVIAWAQRQSYSAKDEGMRREDTSHRSKAETERAAFATKWRERTSPEGRAREEAERAAEARDQKLADERLLRLSRDLPLQAEYRNAVYVEVAPQTNSGLLQIGPRPQHTAGQSALLLINPRTGERLSVVSWGGPEAGNSFLLERPGQEPLRTSLQHLQSIEPKSPAYELDRQWPVDAMVSLSRFMNARGLPRTFWDQRKPSTLYRFKDPFWHESGKPDFLAARADFMQSKGL